MKAVLTQREKPQISQNINFLTSSQIETNDLRQQIKQNEKFLIRQGDIVVTNMELWNLEEVYIPKTALLKKNINVINDSHYLVTQKDKIVLIHNEHGITVLPNVNLHVYHERSYSSKRVLD
jgi:hypothetical protein